MLPIHQKGSGHNRGIAVDLTTVNLRTKKELNMGTGFDNFSDTAHQDFTGLPAKILQNMLLLKTVMEKYGFVSLDTEWWHFSLPDANNYELLNIPFDNIKKLIVSKRISLLWLYTFFQQTTLLPGNIQHFACVHAYNL